MRNLSKAFNFLIRDQCWTLLPLLIRKPSSYSVPLSGWLPRRSPCFLQTTCYTIEVLGCGINHIPLSQLFPCHKRQLIILQIPNHTGVVQCTQGVSQAAQKEQMAPISSCTNNTLRSSCSLIWSHRNGKKLESELIHAFRHFFLIYIHLLYISWESKHFNMYTRGANIATEAASIISRPQSEMPSGYSDKSWWHGSALALSSASFVPV